MSIYVLETHLMCHSINWMPLSLPFAIFHINEALTFAMDFRLMHGTTHDEGHELYRSYVWSLTLFRCHLGSLWQVWRFLRPKGGMLSATVSITMTSIAIARTSGRLCCSLALYLLCFVVSLHKHSAAMAANAICHWFPHPAHGGRSVGEAHFHCTYLWTQSMQQVRSSIANVILWTRDKPFQAYYHQIVPRECFATSRRPNPAGLSNPSR